MLDSQSCSPLPRSHAGTSPIAAWDSGGWGTVYMRWSPVHAHAGQRDKRRFSQGCHQIGSIRACDKELLYQLLYEGQGAAEWKGRGLGPVRPAALDTSLILLQSFLQA